MESPFFYLALFLGKSFIFIQNTERPNEIFLRWDGQEPALKEEAGIALLYFFYE